MLGYISPICAKAPLMEGFPPNFAQLYKSWVCRSKRLLRFLVRPILIRVLILCVCVCVCVPRVMTRVEVRRVDREVGDQGDGRRDSGRCARQVEAGRTSGHRRRQRGRAGRHPAWSRRHEVGTLSLASIHTARRDATQLDRRVALCRSAWIGH